MAKSLTDLTPEDLEIAEEALKLQQKNKKLTKDQIRLLKELGQYHRQDTTYYKKLLDNLSTYNTLLKAREDGERNISRIIEANASMRQAETQHQQQMAENARTQLRLAQESFDVANRKHETAVSTRDATAEYISLLVREKAKTLDAGEETRKLAQYRQEMELHTLESLRAQKAALDQSITGTSEQGRNLSEAAADAEELLNTTRTTATELSRSADATEDFNYGVGQAESGLSQLLTTTLGVRENIHTGLIGGIIGAIESGKPLDDLFTSLKNKAGQMLSPQKLAVAGLTKVFQSTMEFMRQFDSLSAQFRKNTGIIEEGMGGISQRIVNVQRANLAMGVSMDEAFSAASALTSEMASFSHMTDNAQARVLRVTAVMGEFGVSAETTAAIFNNFSKGLGYNEVQLERLGTQLMGLATSLRIPPQIIANEFKGASRDLMKYGGDMMVVFKGLAEQSKRTGLAINQLMGIAQQFDTFEEAGNAVGRLNAILGGPYLSAIDMLYATEADRVKMLRQTIQLTGQQFSQMGRFEKQAIMAAAGINDMSVAMRLFGGTDREFAETSMSMREMQERAQKAQSVQEKFSQIMMSFAIALGPAVEVVSHLADALMVMIAPFNTFAFGLGPKGAATANQIWIAMFALSTGITKFVIPAMKLLEISTLRAFAPLAAGIIAWGAIKALFSILPDKFKRVTTAAIGLAGALAILGTMYGDVSALGRFTVASIAIGATMAAARSSTTTGYAVGTGPSGARGGRSRVAEHGREIIATGRGNYMVDSPSTMNLAQGTQVLSNQNTEKVVNRQVKAEIPSELIQSMASMAAGLEAIKGELTTTRNFMQSEAMAAPQTIEMDGKKVASITGNRLQRGSRLTISRN
jgi:hypothetical protein